MESGGGMELWIRAVKWNREIEWRNGVVNSGREMELGNRARMMI